MRGESQATLGVDGRDSVGHLLLGLTGAGILVYLGAAALREGWRGTAAAGAEPRPAGGRGTQAERTGSQRSTRDRPGVGALNRRALTLGAAISLANPVAVAFRVSVGGTVSIMRTAMACCSWAASSSACCSDGAAWPCAAGCSMACGCALIVFGLALSRAVLAA